MSHKHNIITYNFNKDLQRAKTPAKIKAEKYSLEIYFDTFSLFIVGMQKYCKIFLTT